MSNEIVHQIEIEVNQLNQNATIAYHQGQYEQGIRFAQQAYELAKVHLGTSHPLYTNSLNYLTGLYKVRGRWQEASSIFTESLEIFREQGDRTGEATALMALGTIYGDQKQSQEAINAFTEALEIFREQGDRTGEATALMDLGTIYGDRKQSQEAINAFTEALEICRRQGKYHLLEAEILNNLGTAYLKLSLFQEAKDVYTQSLTIFRDLKDYYGEGLVQKNLVTLYWKQKLSKKSQFWHLTFKNISWFKNLVILLTIIATVTQKVTITEVFICTIAWFFTDRIAYIIILGCRIVNGIRKIGRRDYLKWIVVPEINFFICSGMAIYGACFLLFPVFQRIIEIINQSSSISIETIFFMVSYGLFFILFDIFLILKSIEPIQILLLHSFDSHSYPFAKALSSTSFRVASLFVHPRFEQTNFSFLDFNLKWFGYLKDTIDRISRFVGSKYARDKNWQIAVQKYMELSDAIVVDLSNPRKGVLEEIGILSRNQRLLEKTIFVFRKNIPAFSRDSSDISLIYNTSFSDITTTELNPIYDNLESIIAHYFSESCNTNDLSLIKSEMQMPIQCFPYFLISVKPENPFDLIDVITGEVEEKEIFFLSNQIWKKSPIGQEIVFKISANTPDWLLDISNPSVIPFLVSLLLLIIFWG